MPDRDTIVADPPDRRSAYWLEQAGFVRDDALRLHRIRRDTSASTAERQIRDARRLLASADYGITRVYSADEQRLRAESPPPLGTSAPPGPPRTLGDRTVWVHLVSEDVAAGHLVIHAHHQDPEGSVELLVDYPGAGEAAVLYTEQGSGHYGPSRHATFASARAEWTSYGYAAEAPVPGARRAAAARRTSPVVLGRPGALPAGPPPPVIGAGLAGRGPEPPF
ncbi:hypothetical protein [Kitasatospora sp. NRRL B-11411]|uniref:hypothetical protein n=1 Tax=Kitasatospora sp. NRRL B-11411 TaxID=1463822 RepID=UPI0004C3A75C|nr:hypothetical protein [Kitasatospora sp. NRRL B-11411]